MKEIFKNIQMDSLTDIDEIIYNFVISNSKSIIQMSLSEVCDTIYVSNASVIRFCQKCGYAGFNELKYHIRNELNKKDISLNTFSRIPVASYRLKDFISQIDLKQIEEIAKLIQESESIYIYGRDMSSIPAEYFHTMLTNIDIPCIFIDWFEFIKKLAVTFPENSLLFMFTNWGRTSIYEPIIQQCKERNVKIIWISSDDIEEKVKQYTTYFIHTNEETLGTTRTNTKLNSLLFSQLIIECLLLQNK